MKPEAQRIAIAEACGWKPDDDDDGTGWKGSYIQGNLIGMKPSFTRGKVVSYLIGQRVPDYLSDLNAMYEAEKVLTDEQWKSYVQRIISPLAYMVVGISQAGVRKLAHATATQRAEAFLKTLNLWKP